GAYIQYLELSGTNLTDIPEQQAEISGDLVSVMHELSLRLKSIIKISLRNISNLKEQQVTNYPEIALKELLMNAVMHRNYDSNTPIRFY
ncbi:hypothetical protein, partial [Pseudomonas sp. RTS4]